MSVDVERPELPPNVHAWGSWYYFACPRCGWCGWLRPNPEAADTDGWAHGRAKADARSG